MSSHTTIIIVGSKIDTYKRDFLVKSGFIMSGINLSRSVRSDDLYRVINQLVSKNIPFSLKTTTPNYSSVPCVSCKR